MIVITGMHRSGTSAISGILASLGLDFGPAADLLPADRWNATGYLENREIFRLNVEIITGLGKFTPLWEIPYERRTAVQKLAMLAVKARYLMMPSARSLAVRAHRQRLAMAEIGSRFQGIGVKDPRFCLLASDWAATSSIERLIFVHRHPAEIVASLRRREGLPRALGYRFWRYHVSAFLRAVDEKEIPFWLVDYNALFDREKQDEQARSVFGFLGGEYDATSWIEATGQRLETSLRHHRAPATLVPGGVARLVHDVRARAIVP